MRPVTRTQSQPHFSPVANYWRPSEETSKSPEENWTGIQTSPALPAILQRSEFSEQRALAGRASDGQESATREPHSPATQAPSLPSNGAHLVGRWNWERRLSLRSRCPITEVERANAVPSPCFGCWEDEDFVGNWT